MRRLAVLALVALLAAGLWATVVRSGHRLRASRVAWQVQRQAEAVAAGQLPPRILLGAVRALREAEQLAPESIELRSQQGDVQMLLGRLDAAERAYREALALEPRPEVHLNLGRVLWHRGERDEAARQFAAAVTLDPQLRRHLPPGAAAPPPR